MGEPSTRCCPCLACVVWWQSCGDLGVRHQSHHKQRDVLNRVLQLNIVLLLFAAAICALSCHTYLSFQLHDQVWVSILDEQ
jgi:hypothetical protein